MHVTARADFKIHKDNKIQSDQLQILLVELSNLPHFFMTM